MKTKKCTHVLWTTGNPLFSRPREENGFPSQKSALLEVPNLCNRDGGHSGGQKHKNIPPLGTNLLFYANFTKQILFYVQQHRCLVTLLQTSSVSFPPFRSKVLDHNFHLAYKVWHCCWYLWLCILLLGCWSNRQATKLTVIL